MAQGNLKMQLHGRAGALPEHRAEQMTTYDPLG